MSVNATTPAGAVVKFSTEATDLVDGAVTPICVPISGSTFPINLSGEFSIVNCTASDGRTPPNTSTISFHIHVKGAVEQISDLATLIDGFNLKNGENQKFDHQLDQVEKSSCEKPDR